MGPKYGALATAQNNYTKQRFGGTVKPTPAPGAVPLCKQTRTQASQGSTTDVRPAHVLPKTEGISAKPSKPTSASVSRRLASREVPKIKKNKTKVRVSIKKSCLWQCVDMILVPNMS